ncbi:MAG: aspartyl-tRNA(Asn)/glutamyl-tRNA(Gln) amidotransferase subunit [Patescibacteria group bacterium]|nr:Asp-tRNA(Asn)/Glu-tRNA(Gln) amidotransferase subunit GatA [Candidatus Saccharibacteria bacterium]MDQ5962987.1 aspartyl-tRNA(Asn)/glutamyl-tRNA(Gln) amidotransferase subunit [Patescibacteria group bacterium]
MSTNWKPIAELAAEVQSGATTATELVERSLAAIEEHKEFNAIIAPLAESARSRAKFIDQKVASGDEVGRLAGVPFIAKDNFLVFGAETTAASNILKGFNAPYQSTVIELLEAEGAICVAKANLDAFAHGSSTENSDFFTTLNPHDKTRVPGGSSGGSGAAVALQLAPFALGSDTGGSIRLPASFTGTVGFKPTYGLVSRSGVVAMGSSLDTIGPITTRVEDAALVVDVIAQKDPLDSTMVSRDEDGYVLTEATKPLMGMKIGVITEYMQSGLDEGVRNAVQQTLDAMKAAGAELVDISLPSLPLGLAVYYVLCPAEVSSNLSRYDGQRYAHHMPDAKNLEESYTRTRETGFGSEAKRRVLIGTYVLSSGYYDAYYKKAQTVRTKVIEEFAEAFRQVDFLIGPTSPSIAFKVGENAADPLKMYLADIMTVAANLAGVPAISIPCGTSEGMPVGLQIMAAQKKDRQVFELARSVEGLLK